MLDLLVKDFNYSKYVQIIRKHVILKENICIISTSFLVFYICCAIIILLFSFNMTWPCIYINSAVENCNNWNENFTRNAQHHFWADRRKKPMNLKITQLRLSSLRNRKKKEWGNINRFSESCGHHQTYQHMHNGNLSRRGERKRGRKNTWRYIGRKLQNLVKKIISYFTSNIYK